MESVKFWQPFCIFLLFVGLLNVSHAEGEIIFPDEIKSEFNVSNSILKMVAPVGDGGCQTEKGEKGECLALKDCPELENLIKSQNGIRTPGTADFLRRRICKYKARSANFCCARKTEAVPHSLAPSHLTSMLPSKNECGLSLRLKVRGGRGFTHGAHPWLVGVGYPIENKPFQVECGGTLITRKHVLTAAHCFYKDPRLRPTPDCTHVILGEHSLSKETEKKKHLVLRITERKEPGYNKTALYHDISLLVLEKEVIFTTYIRPACLPFDLNEGDIDFKNEEPIIAGWGRTYFGELSGTDEPLETGVSFVSKSECRKAYGFAPLIPFDDTQICFGNDGRDACQGDSGGPLLYRDTKKFMRYFLLGTAAFGYKCGDLYHPGIYTYVPPYLKWITENL